MPRPRLDDVRKPQLTAAMRCLIADGGLENTSLDQIARQAGLARGMMRHYFGSKDALIEETLRTMNREYATVLAAGIEKAEDPIGRLRAFVDESFSPTIFTAENRIVWLVFWSRVPHVPRLRRVHRIITRRTRTYLARIFAGIVPPDTAAAEARALNMMIDGIWLRAALDEGEVTAEAAAAIAHRYLDLLLSSG